jgi:hypothetical protein
MVVSLESVNWALARVYGFLPRADEELASSMERQGRHTGAVHWDGSSSSPRNLTLLVGWRTAPRKMDEDVSTGPPPCRTSPRVVGHTCDGDEAVTETRKAEAGAGDRRRKAGRNVY